MFSSNGIGILERWCNGSTRPWKEVTTKPNVDNRPFFLSQSTDSHRKSTSLMWTIHYKLCSLIDLPFSEGKNNLQLTACQYSQRYHTPDSMIVDITVRLFWHKTSYAENAGFWMSNGMWQCSTLTLVHLPWTSENSCWASKSVLQLAPRLVVFCEQNKFSTTH